MISKIWNFISQISGVYGTFVLAIGGGIWLVHLIKGLKLPSLVFVPTITATVILFFGSLTFFIKQNRFLIKNIKKYFLEKEAQKSIIKFTAKANASPQELILPDAKQLKALRKIAIEEAKSWVDDISENSIVIRISRQNQKFSIRAQDIFYSKWKNQRLDIFVGEKISFYKEEINSFNDTRSHLPFFEKYKDWDKAVLQAYKKIENKISTIDYQLNLHSHYSVFHFDFVYKEGDVSKKLFFDFDGSYLTSGDGSKLKIT